MTFSSSLAALGMTTGLGISPFMVRPATDAASVVGRAVSALADSPGQLPHEGSERDLPHERLTRQVVAAKGPQPLDVPVPDAQPYVERAQHDGSRLRQHPFGADANRTPIPPHEHTGQLHDVD